MEQARGGSTHQPKPSIQRILLGINIHWCNLKNEKHNYGAVKVWGHDNERDKPPVWEHSLGSAVQIACSQLVALIAASDSLKLEQTGGRFMQYVETLYTTNFAPDLLPTVRIEKWYERD